MKNSIPLIEGIEANFTYGELQKEMDMLNITYIDVMKEGDSKVDFLYIHAISLKISLEKVKIL